METPNYMNEKSAFIAIVGRPNVGKSSILNRLIGTKLAIVSSKPQTTRTRIMGVWTEGETQLVFIDTPGLIKPNNSLGDYMVKSVTQSVAGVDACLLVTEAGTKISKADEELAARFKSIGLPAVLAINKIDLLEDKSLLTQPGGHFFAEDTLTDQPERVIAAEIVREKILRFTDKEIPHGVAVVTESMKERGDITDIDATIYCERDTHKGILIGKGGAMLKKIGSKAREDMERFFGCRINLRLWVKVKEDWRQRPGVLTALGFDKRDLLN